MGNGLTDSVEDFLAALPDPAVAISADGQILHANSAAHALVPGLNAGMPIVRAFRAPEVLDAVRRARPGSPCTAIWRDRVPVERVFAVHAATLGPAGAGGAVLLILRDQSQLRRTEQMRTDFVANASHELRTPLASLIGFLDTLQGAARDDPIARTRFLAIMSEQARRMSRLLDDLLSLSRVEQALHLPPNGAADLSALAAQTCNGLAPIADESHARLRLHAPRSVSVRGDRDELLRVADNLIENAIKHGGPGTVTVEVRVEDGLGMLRVGDTGPGVPPPHLPRLTERFYRVDNAASRTKGGTGLGLAIVKHIVARHRGRLRIEAGPEGGLRVTVLLPLADTKTPTG